MIASATWKAGTTQYVGRSESGHSVLFDTDAAHTLGASPMEAVLAALCGCTSVDVVSILEKKRQAVTSLVVSAYAEQAAAPPRVFTHIRLTYRVGGVLSRKAVEDAVALSKGKYCSVSKMLEQAVRIDYAIEYADGEPGA